MDKKALLRRLGHRVKEVRAERKMTQRQLADAVGKEQPSINRLETGDINPSFIYLTEIAQGLDIELSELIKLPDARF